jgi:large repetitive protein
MSGLYSVTVTVAGCTSPPGTTTVSVNPAPTTPTASSNSPVCVGSTINLTANTIAGATYSWTGPNGFTSTSQNPIITSSTTLMSGVYSVIASVGTCVSSAGTTTVTINPTPTSPIANSNSPVCVGSQINLSSNLIPGATYAWSGPNGYLSAIQNPSIPNSTVAMTGTYSLTITVGGCTSLPSTTNVVVNTIPTTPTIASNSPICEGSSINLTTNAVTGATYSWTGPNGFTSTSQNPSITGATSAMAGTYSLTVSIGICNSPVGSTTVVVNPLPSAPLATSNSPVCVGSTINLSASTVTGATYSWTGPNGFTSISPKSYNHKCRPYYGRFL